MRNRKRAQVTLVTDWVLRLGTVAAAVLVSLAALAAPASAATLAAPSPAPFGLLGPVGIVAVGIGVAGMIAGLARRRREALARSVAARSAAAERATAERASRVAATHGASARGERVPAPSQPPAVERTGPQPVVRATRAA